MSTEVNHTEIEDRMERLQNEYGDVPIEDKRWERSPQAFEELLGSARDGYLGGAYAWVVRNQENAPSLTDSMPESASDDHPRVLMALGRGMNAWGLAGGGREDGETFEETAIREVKEETNVRCSLTEPFLLRKATVISEGNHDQRIHLLYVFFDAEYRGGTVAIQGGELNGAAWFAEPPERMMPANELRAEDWF
ncbi:NUDIX domain-containing protein [Haladaptatus litoreus]|uniref:NUDIX domain-containing protein n=1 Tax=Haladaptatus litoreus TaxID=553468 RepID=A0A1N6VTJ9_9EURY|nr:NUDIX domain-containing protein [Haladaptatus litoreus]SIQ81191.1 NUDIX domain-containing protein [Haladaptatus litoreus]